MVEIGNRLKEARLARGLTPEDVEEETKIRKKYIMALEMEQFEILPGPIYARAFLKNYAKYLNIDPNEITDAFKQKQGGETVYEEYDIQPAEKNITTEKIAKKKPAANRKPLHWQSIAAVLLIAAVVVSLVYGGKGLWSNYIATKGVQQIEEQTATPDNNGQQDPIQGDVINNSGVKIDLNVVSDRCWVLVTVDEKEEFQGELSTGESKSFTGKNNIHIILGNAGVVEVLENEQSLGFLGSWGDVVEREFKAPAVQ
ncbi:MAG: Helix-turn-helix domain protein [Firmicutes bacterium ADurb.Bin373]|nr:MAG: Helix-turn-helix domain protein [Firmicutes bacterium ADurb.Bin373]